MCKALYNGSRMKCKMKEIFHVWTPLWQSFSTLNLRHLYKRLFKLISVFYCFVICSNFHWLYQETQYFQSAFNNLTTWRMNNFQRQSYKDVFQVSSNSKAKKKSTLQMRCSAFSTIKLEFLNGHLSYPFNYFTSEFFHAVWNFWVSSNSLGNSREYIASHK